MSVFRQCFSLLSFVGVLSPLPPLRDVVTSEQHAIASPPLSVGRRRAKSSITRAATSTLPVDDLAAEADEPSYRTFMAELQHEIDARGGAKKACQIDLQAASAPSPSVDRPRARSLVTRRRPLGKSLTTFRSRPRASLFANRPLSSPPRLDSDTVAAGRDTKDYTSMISGTHNACHLLLKNKTHILLF